ncbi:hypothetical protein L210DRAFT_948756 [Boletus edulis BED1]|uniref:Uncharacterized protein n=1 Tax=Boletus edulis BED1 TaxID=1328754 RepID=A0AAD4BVR2_BOLED|nr:hypothetical protein L210DRAFT_948756 [Boletus edulis BED1]
MILNWPDGVVREKERGMYSLSIEQAGKLRHALTREDDRRLRFGRSTNEMTESTVNNEGIASESHPCTSSSKRTHRCSGCGRPGKKSKFRVTTAENYAESANDGRGA